MVTPHAQLVLTLTGNPEKDKATLGMLICSFTGCRQCMIQSMGMLLAYDPDFKDLINSAVRFANEIKAKKEN